MKETVLFRVDGGKVWGISMGHIKRSLLLSSLLAEEYRIVYIMRNYQDGVAYVRKQRIEVETIDIDDDRDDLLIQLSEKYAPAKIIFDLRITPYIDIFDYARVNNIQTVVFDIIGKCAGSPDILINDSFVEEFTKYPHLNIQTKLALGPEYFLLEKQPDITPIKSTVQDLMITMGGSDPADLTVKVLSALMKQNIEYNINIVLGPSFTEHKKICGLVNNKSNIKIHQNPANFLELLSRQDIVVTAAGRTLYECAYLGRPVVIVPSIEHEAVTSAAYSRLTGSLNIGLWDETTSPIKIHNALSAYIDNYNLRASVFSTSRSLVDGQAVKRILPLLEND